MSERLDITVIPNGPLKIAGLRSVRFCGEELEAGSEAYICRCGESTNPPFCDGTHAKVGFKGENTLSEKKPVRVWEGRNIRTRFDPNVCMHVFHCKPLNALREAELAGDDSAAAKIAEVVMSCPSGALTYEVKSDVSEPRLGGGAQLDIQEGGEVRVQCTFDINADLEDGQPDNRATLCRCGRSVNKPWCDGRHKAKRGFK